MMAQDPRVLVYEAIRAGNVEQVRKLLQAHPEQVTGSESRWLSEAASRDQVQMAEMLVREFGIDVNWPRWQGADPDRPLCQAAREGCLQMARWLLDHGADVEGAGATPPL